MSDSTPAPGKRRDFLKGVATAVSGLAIGSSLPRTASAAADKARSTGAAGTMIDFAAPRLDTVRMGLIGTGARGMTHLRLLLGMQGATVRAVCDTDPVSLANAQDAVAKSGQAKPGYYTGGDYAYRRLLERDDIDAVVISTPWRWHEPMAVQAMQSGKHALVEVPLATTIDEMWRMVEVSEKTRMNCMMLENVCYGRDEMMVFNMVRRGLFGDLTHGEGAYIHDLRMQMKQIERGTGSWRTYYHTTMQGNIYPTHGLGPIAQYMDINRGDRFDYMTSLSSPALGRAAYARREFPSGHERNRLRYLKGDMNSTLLKTARGRSILVQYDTTTARPYSRLNLIQGTNGAFGGFPNRIALETPPQDIREEYAAAYEAAVAAWEAGGGEGSEPRAASYHGWDRDMYKWRQRFEHPFWRDMMAAATTAGGHGGMDFMMHWRIVHCLRNGVPLDQNVYDGASWSSLFPLSHESVVNRSKPVDIPDFTRGAWRSAARLNIAL